MAWSCWKCCAPTRNLLDLNVFIMTTSDLESDRLKAQQLAVSGYIIKPLSFDTFGEGGTSVDGFSLFLDLLKLKS